LTLVSQIRSADVDGASELVKVKADLKKALEKVSAIYGFDIRNSSILCVSPPTWYRLYSPSLLLVAIIFCFLVIRNRNPGPSWE
jgi:hypothetical protein